jgi:hypothetical protein
VRGLYGILGAVMVGWMVALWFVATGPLRKRQRWAWNLCAASVASWFVLDTMASAIYIPRNVILNAIFFVGFAVPMLMMRSELTD